MAWTGCCWPGQLATVSQEYQVGSEGKFPTFEKPNEKSPHHGAEADDDDDDDDDDDGATASAAATAAAAAAAAAAALGDDDDDDDAGAIADAGTADGNDDDDDDDDDDDGIEDDEDDVVTFDITALRARSAEMYCGDFITSCRSFWFSSVCDISKRCLP